MKFKNSSMHNDLLIAADKILIEEGIDSINIRHLSEKTGIPTGTIYNYFSSKEEILIALTAEFWNQALDEIQWKQFNSFIDFIIYTHEILNESMTKHDSLIMKQLTTKHARGLNQVKLMNQQVSHVMIQALNRDEHITTIWTNDFTKEQFVSFIVSQLLISIRREYYDMNFCLQVLKRILYNEVS